MKEFKVNILIAAILVGTLLVGCSSKAVTNLNQARTSDTISESQDSDVISSAEDETQFLYDEYLMNDSDYEKTSDINSDSESYAASNVRAKTLKVQRRLPQQTAALQIQKALPQQTAALQTQKALPQQTAALQIQKNLPQQTAALQIQKALPQQTITQQVQRHLIRH